MNDATTDGQGLAIDDLTFSASTAAPNTAPVLDAVTNKFVHYGQMLSFTASAIDADQPPQILTFTLDPGAPADASIGSTTGDFTWVTTNATVPSTNNITIRVTDDGTPPLSATSTFSVMVMPLPQFGSMRPTGTTLPLTFSTLPGQSYQVQYKTNLSDASWTPINPAVPGYWRAGGGGR